MFSYRITRSILSPKQIMLISVAVHYNEGLRDY